MTRLPMESWNVKPRPDLPEYELNAIDAKPGSSAPASENHHLWRRSFGKDYRESWWVELEDGTVVPNRVGLSLASHEAVERGGHRIVARKVDGQVFFYWLTPGALEIIASRGLNEYEVASEYGLPLWPQPGPAKRAMQTTIDGDEVPHEHVSAESEEECPRCHGAGRIVKKPKVDQPQAAERPKTVYAVRVPKDEREDGHEVLSNLVDTAIDKLAEANLIRDRNKGASYYALVYVLAFFAQNFKPEAEKAS